MGSAAQFLAQFFPLFLLGALFGKLMDDSGSVRAISRFMTERLGSRHAMLAVVLAGAMVTYGGVSLVCRLLRAGADGAGTVSGRRHTPPVDAGSDRSRHIDIYDVGAAGHARYPERDPDAVLRHHAFCGSWPRHHRLGHHAGIRHVVAASRPGRRPARWRRIRRRLQWSLPRQPLKISSFGSGRRPLANSTPPNFVMGTPARACRPSALAVLPLVTVVGVNFLMAMFVLPHLDFSFLAEERWGSTSLSAVAGVWSVVVALASATGVLILVNHKRLPALRDSMDAGANASVLPALSVASLVGFGAVIAMLPAFAVVRDWVLVDWRRPAGFARRRDQCARRAHRFGLGRPDDRARCAR